VQMQKAMPAILVAVLVSVLVGIGYRFLATERASATVTGPAARVTRLRATGSTPVWFTLPESAGRTDITVEPAEVVGLAGRELRLGMPVWDGWKVAHIGADGVHLLPMANRTPVYLGLKDGYVAIFLGPPSMGVVEEVTGIRASGLLAADQARLQRGVGAPDLVHAWQLIEGLEQ
jgi:hypothetical protein